MKKILHYFILFLTASVSAQEAANIDLVVGTNFKGYNYVQAIAIQPDQKAIVGGNFGYTNSGSSLDGRVLRFNIDGSIDTSFQVDTSDMLRIKDLIIQPDSKILLLAIFKIEGHGGYTKLVRLNDNGTLDSTFLATPVSGVIDVMALQADNKIIMGGAISTFIGNYSQKGLVRLNSDGSIDPSFALGELGFVPNVTINKITLQADGKVLVGGSFESFNNQIQKHLIRFNSDGTKDTSFNIGSGGEGNGLSDIVLLPNGKILIAGALNTFNGKVGRIHRLNNDGTLDNSFNFNGNSLYISHIGLNTSGNMIVIGNFTVDNKLHRIVKLNEDGTLSDTFSSIQPTENLGCLKIQVDGKILVGGFLNKMGEVLRNRLARLTPDGFIDPTYNLNTGLNDQVFSIASQSDDKTILVGNFTRFEGLPQGRIIRLNNDGTKDMNFNIGTGFNKSVKQILLDLNGKIIVAGDFTDFNGSLVNHLIRLNSDGSIDNTFNIGSGFNNSVLTIALQSDGKILVGGMFTAFNGQLQNYCIRLNYNGTKDSSFDIASSFDDKVTKIAVHPNGKIMVGGNFITFNGINQRYLALLNVDGSKDPNFVVGESFSVNFPFGFPDNVVDDIAIQEDGKVLVLAKSYFYKEQKWGQPLRLTLDGSVDETFEHSVVFGQGSLNSLAIQQDGKILVGGGYSKINTGYLDQKRLIRLNPNGGKDTTFDIYGGLGLWAGGFGEGSVNCISFDSNNRIWIGGSFFNYKSISSFSAIRLVGDSYLSVNDNALMKSEIILSPNPVTNILYINKIVTNLIITDVTGKTLTVKRNLDRVDMSNYSKGLYFFTIEDDNGAVKTIRIVKE